MAFRWVCNTCGSLHGSNPTQCRSCGSSILSPASRERISNHASNPTEVKSLDPEKILTYGTTPEPDYPSSPDVATDGSMEAPTVQNGVSEESDSNWLTPWRVLLAFSLLLLYGMVGFFFL